MEKAQVLVVEDEWNLAQQIQGVLERSGFDVCGIASSGEEAIAQAEISKPDLALMDIVLAGNMDGIEAARQLHRRMDIPIIFLTAHGDDKVIKQAKDTEPLAYILKPYKEQELLATIEIALHQYRASRGRAQDAVRDTEARFRAIFERSAVGITLLNREGRVVESNPALQTMLGYTGQELLEMYFPDFTYPDDIAEDKALFTQLMNGEREYYQLDKRYVDKSGKVIWAKLAASLIRDKGGRPSYAIRMVEDITDHKRIEEALSISEERYRMLVELSPDGVFIHRNDQIEFINPAGLHLLGATHPDQVLGKSIFEIIHPDYHALIRARIEEMNQSGKAAPFIEERVVRIDGTVVPVEVAASQFIDRKGQAIQVIYHDITERIQAEEQMQRNTLRAEELAEISKALAEVGPDQQGVVEIIAQRVSDVIGDCCVVSLISDDGRSLIPAAVQQSTPDDGEFTRELLMANPERIGEGLAGRVAQSGEPILIPALTREQALEVIQPEFAPYVQRFGLYGLLIVPLRAQGRVMGALGVIRNQPGKPYSENDRVFLQDLADRAGLAIENARLFAQTNHRLRDVQALRTIDTAITGSLDLGLTLSVILEQVTTQQGVDAADVLLLNSHNHVLEFTAGRGFRTNGMLGSQLRLGEGYSGQVALERQTIYISDLAAVNKDFARADMIRGEGFSTYCGVPLIAKGVVKGVLEIFHRSRMDVSPEWLAFLETLAGQAAIAVDSAQMFSGLQRSNIDLMLAYDATIEGWSKALDLRDKETEGHSQRVTGLAEKLARSMGMGEADLVHLRRGALLHDIGKMGIPDRILHKTSPLDDEERAIMQQHPLYAFELLAPISYLRSAIAIPYCHHEHWDGSGYPRGLKGEQIPLEARIFAVVDTWDALCSDRPYRLAWPKNQVEDHIRSLSGINFDPQAVDAFLRMIK